MILRRRVVRAVGVLLLAVGATAGCTHSGSPARTGAASGGATSPDRTPVRVLGVWSGPELDSFLTVKSAWEKSTGERVDWEGTQDLPTVLRSRLQAGNPPDIAVLPTLALMRQLARDGKLVPVDSVLDMKQAHRDYAPAWIDLGGLGGRLYGIFYKVTDKATVWYSPRAFAAGHYRVPVTWQDLIRLASRMVSDGRTPFSVVAASGPANGWALTDWISEIVLNKCGPAYYDRWIAAEVPWTDGCVLQSFELFDRIVHTKGYVLGGEQRVLTTTDADGADPLYSHPPAAYLYYLASFAQGFIAAKDPTLQPGRDYSFFPFPTINGRFRGAVTMGADVVVMTHDTPAARSFLRYLAGERAQQAWIKLGGFTSVNRSVPAGAYPDPVARAVAEHLTRAAVTRFSAGDMMPAALQRAWWAGMLELVKDPGRLDPILRSLTGLARSSR